jgi:simple sugar transport system ATP-binding protein
LAVSDAAPILALRGITKRFGALVANDDISLSLREGEVLALLGENGAGKSTLVSILFGHYLADAGSIEVFGKPLPPGSPRAALAAGVGMVHQHFTLADNLSVLDNILLGTEPLAGLSSRRRAASARVRELARKFGLSVDPSARVGALSVGERQRVEILKALYRNARILILDEPTAVLTPQEVDSLFATLRQMVADGMSVIFISHKLDEVLAISDRVAVLRAGKLVAERAAQGATKAQLAELMVGREVRMPQREAGHSVGKVLLSLRGVTTAPVHGRAGLDAVDLEVRAGEILAIAGVAGNGQDVLADLLSGLLEPTGGSITVLSRSIVADPRAWVDAGVGRVPEDRQGAGVVGDLTVWKNAILERYRDRRYHRMGLMNNAAARAQARRIVERFDVRLRSIEAPARSLSGGNIQKLILGRVLGESPRVLVVNQPTWGLDVGAVSFIHGELLAARRAGAAILLISEDLDEVFALADRIAVMHRGRTTPARPAEEWTLASIGLAMAGARAAEAAAAPH